MDLMNQRKELIVTHVRTRRDSSATMHYSSSKERGAMKYNKKMPDYVQNM